MKKVVVDNTSMPASLSLYEDDMLRGSKEIDNHVEAINVIINGVDDPFEQMRMRRMIMKINATFGIQKITFEEKK